jgi:type I restriction enzyme R subunit
MARTEAETRTDLIDPALYTRGWTEDLIRREETAGVIEIIGGKAKRWQKGRIDYTLRVKVHADTQPVALALIEAKKEELPPGHGMEQGKIYSACERLNVRFVFSTNGHMFVEYDKFTGLTSRPRPMSEFPTPAELRHRYETGMGFTLDSASAKPLLAPYPGGEGTRRYYQDAAIRAVLEKVAACQIAGVPPRALLSLATGSGKTFIAVHLLKKVADAGQLRRALFICDRDELRKQALGAFQNAFGSNAAAATSTNPERNARIVVATYQTLDIDGDDGSGTFLERHYPLDYFSHIIIDECHRSAWGKWSEVLRRNPNAVQVGLTATPREIDGLPDTAETREDAEITADNIRYFGDPVYEYTLAQAIEDGYLAACEIQKGRVNLDNTGITLEQVIARNPIDAITGRRITIQELKDRYERTEFEERIMLPDRVLAMCQDLFNFLLETGGPEQKTIIFCARDRHADEVAAHMNNLYAMWCSEQGRQRAEPYAFKCTAESAGNDYLPDFRGSSRHHFIATTVDLLTTGVDVPRVQNIVFFRYLKSAIAFYQMVGRGTRIDVVEKKLMFRVYDYTDATRLFGGAFLTKLKPRTAGGPGHDGPAEPTIMVEGFNVQISDAGRFVVGQVNGQARPVPLEEFRETIALALLADAPHVGRFRTTWLDPDARGALLRQLVERGTPATVLRMASGMDAYDLFDVLAELAYGVVPRTRKDRAAAFAYKHAAWLSGLPPRAAGVCLAVVRQFEISGTEGLENPRIFDTPDVRQAGGMAAMQSAGDARQLYRDVKERVFSA